MSAAVEAEGIRKQFGEHRVLKGVDLEVARGSILALLGPNGAGKTTLVRILSTLTRADAGEARVDGWSVNSEPHRVRSSIGLTGQYASVDGLLTGRENLVMMARLLRMRPRAARHRASELLKRFRLDDTADRRVETYSGGVRRRLDLAASLLATPPILFLDEPTTGLDPVSRRELWAAIGDLAGDGVTILLTTQYLEEADRLADRVAVLGDGRIVAEGTPAELKQKIGEERLTVVISDPVQLNRAVGVATDWGHQVRACTLTVPIRQPDQIREFLNALSEHDVAIEGVSLTAPTLDDVFFAFTEPKEVSR